MTHTIVDAFGTVIDQTVQPGTDVYRRVTPASSGITLTATTSDYCSGRVLTGVAVPGPAQWLVLSLTPVALTIPARVTMEFDITWEASQDRTDTVGECG